MGNARHLYDIHCLLGDARVRDALEALGADGIAQLCADVDEHSAAAGFGYTPRPAGGFADGPLLADNPPVRRILEVGYNDAMALVYGARPSIEDCLASIRSNAHLL